MRNYPRVAAPHNHSGSLGPQKMDRPATDSARAPCYGVGMIRDTGRSFTHAPRPRRVREVETGWRAILNS